MDRLHFVSSPGGHLVCLYFLANVNDDSINTCVQVSVLKHMYSILLVSFPD